MKFAAALPITASNDPISVRDFAWLDQGRKLQSLGVTQIALSTPPDLHGDAALRRLIEARVALAAELATA